MLAREWRMRDGADFARTIRRGSKRVTPTLVIHTLPDEPTRVGFVVSKAVGNAVTRNRVKRQLRHAMQKFAHSMSVGHVVVRALPAAAGRSSADLSADLERALGPAR